MAHMIANTSFFVIRPLVTFGTFPTTASSLVIGLKVDMKFTPNIIERPLHTGVITDTVCNSVYASSLGTVTIDGALSLDYKPLFDSYFQKTIGATATQFGTGSISFTIMQLDSKNLTKCRYATGCTVKSINISGTPQDYIKMTVLLPAKFVSDWVTRPSISGLYPTGPVCHEPILFSSLSHNKYSNISSYTLNLDSELIENSVRYGTSFTPVNNIMVKKMITETIETLFDPTSADTPIADVNTTQLGTVAISTITMNINETLQNYDLADPMTGVFKNSFELKANQDESYPAIDILF